MEACEVVRLFVNKAIVSAEPKRRGNPGYGRLRALRVLVYARLKGLENDTRVVEHLKKHSDAARTLGLCKVPDRTTVGRWWRRYLGLLEETFVKISGMLQLMSPTTFLIVDSTPLVDLYDMEAGWGHTSRGKFRGFKLHAAVNQLGLPLRAVVTSGNRYDSPFLPKLIEDLEADYVLADAGIRFGYAVAAGNLIDKLQTTRLPWSINGLACQVTLAALNDKEFIKNTKETIA